MTEDEYRVLALRTLSLSFHTDKVPPHELDGALHAASVGVAWMDDCKKSLFYGKEMKRRTGRGGACSIRYPVTTSSEFLPVDQIMHAIIGLFTESGELLEWLKNALSGKTDWTNLEEEIGDLLWYLAVLSSAANLDLPEIRKKNIKKLQTRYPDKFTEANALTRDLPSERSSLEE